MEGSQVQLKDREVVDSAGARVGKVSDVLFDDSSGFEPKWLVVNPGLFKAEHFVPAAGAVVDETSVRVPYDIETVRASLKAPGDHIVSSAAKAALRDHYGLPE